MLEIMPYSDELRSEWDGIVFNSKNGNFLFKRDYIDYHKKRFNEKSLLVYKKNKCIALFPCNENSRNIISHGGLTYGGLIYGRNLKAKEVLDILTLIIDHFKSINIKSIIYKSIPHIYHKYPSEEDLYAIFRLGGKLVRRDITSAIKLSDRIKLSDSRKSIINKAKKYNINISEGYFFNEFYKILAFALERHDKVPVHSLSEIELLAKNFPDSIRLFGLFENNVLIAGVVVYDFGSVIHTQYMATSDRGRHIGALDCLLEELISNVFSTREYFNFGISTEDEGLTLNEGLIFQKEGFGGRGIAQDFYEIKIGE